MCIRDRRKLAEKTSVKTPYLEQFCSYGNKTRDPRGWSVTTVYFALIPSENLELEAGQGATDIKWVAVKKGRVKDKLAFDHAKILAECTDRLKSKLLYTCLLYTSPSPRDRTRSRMPSSA